jgi:FtsH-binding integral membrane protein
MPDRLIAILSKGGPLPRLWPIYIAFGAISFGFLSIPSTGAAIVLIPMFLMAGVAILYGCMVCPRHNQPISGRRLTVIGLALMVVASWTRGIALWGVGQHGAGSAILATVVWAWITVGCVFLLIAVWTRGLG